MVEALKAAASVCLDGIINGVDIWSVCGKTCNLTLVQVAELSVSGSHTGLKGYIIGDSWHIALAAVREVDLACHPVDAVASLVRSVFKAVHLIP